MDKKKTTKTARQKSISYCADTLLQLTHHGYDEESNETIFIKIFLEMPICLLLQIHFDFYHM